jgi:hypothetical protein
MHDFPGGQTMFWRASSAVAVLSLFVSAAQANFFSDRVAANFDLKKEVGTGISAIAQPTIDSAQTAAQTVLDNADQRLGARLGQVDTTIGKTVQNVDVLLEHRIGQVDGIAATRLKEIDSIADKQIKRIDNTIAASITRIDNVLQARTIDIDDLLRANIADVDERLGARLQQVDELTERRLGNVETLAAKSTAAIGSAVLRLIAFACLLVFAAAAVWRIYVESTGAWPADGSLFSRIAAWWRKVHGRLGWQLGGAAACIVVLFLVFMQFIPSGSSEQLEKTHLRELQRAIASLDLTEAKYHVSQLKILDPNNPAYRAYALKIDLVRDVLSRPALYQTAGGIRQTLSRIDQAERVFDPHHDRDIDTVKALILFRTNPSRQNEHDATMFCAAALHRGDDDAGFALRPLALNFVQNYLSHPLPDPEPETDGPKEYASADLTALVSKSVKANALTPLSPVLTYDGYVRELMHASLPAYRQMLEAEAEVAAAPPARRAELIEKRRTAARAVIKAWEDFDDALASHHTLDDTSAAYAVFTLNDALVSRARAYAASTKPDIPPLLNETNYPDAASRARMLPPRVMWAKRYLGNAGPSVRSVVVTQETDRFHRYESALHEFEKTYIDYLRTKNGSSGYAAALAAARLGLDADVPAPLTDEQRKTVEQARREAPVAYL